MAHPFREIRAWQACHTLALTLYAATKKFPRDELFALTAQTRRAAYSAPANIAEGAAKGSDREFRRYLNIALGSLGELEYALLMAHDLKYLDAAAWRKLEELRSTASKLTWGLYSSLK